MAVTGSARAPLPLSWLILAGLVLVFLGERILDFSVALRLGCTALGVFFVLAALVWRAVTWRRAHGDRARVERTLLVATGGVALALLLYFLSMDATLDKLGWFLDPKARERFQTPLAVLWTVLLAASVLALVLAQLADGSLGSRRAGTRDHVEAHRVGEAARSGIIIALAAGSLFLAAYVASERDVKWDVSYFKTSGPGSATVSMVKSLEEPLVVKLFFPDVSEVKEEVLEYFRSLATETGRVDVEVLDRLVAPELARQYRVRDDGTVVLVKGEQFESINVGPDMSMARARLRKLDSEVQEAFMKVARSARIAYLTVGHGEINDPASAGADSRPFVGGVTLLRQILGLLNYQVKDLGLAQGLGSKVPDDAAMVLVLGPREDLLDQELETLAAYVRGGGSLLLAVDPEGSGKLGAVGGSRRAHVRPRHSSSTTSSIFPTAATAPTIASSSPTSSPRTPRSPRCRGRAPGRESCCPRQARSRRPTAPSRASSAPRSCGHCPRRFATPTATSSTTTTSRASPTGWPWPSRANRQRTTTRRGCSSPPTRPCGATSSLAACLSTSSSCPTW